MLQVNQLCGFGGRRRRGPSPQLRFANSYTLTFTSTTTATATVAALDLGFPAGANKQILVASALEVSVVTGVTINGVAAVRTALTGGGFSELWSAFYAGSGPFNIVFTTSASSTDVTRIAVYEVLDAAPLYQSASWGEARTGTVITMPLRVPDTGLAVAVAHSNTDTNSITWTGLTGTLNVDGGTLRNASADLEVNVVGTTDLSIVATQTGSAVMSGQAQAILPASPAMLSGKLYRTRGTSFSGGATVTFSTNDFTGYGSFKLVVAVTCIANATINGVTFNGNAMTSLGVVKNSGPSPDMNIGFFAIDVTQAAPSGNIVVTMSGASIGDTIDIAQWLVFNMGSFGTLQSVQGNATGAALSVDVSAGGMILAATIRPTGQTTTWTGVSEQRDTDTAIDAYSLADRSYCAAETARTVQAVGSGSGQYITAAIACNP